MSQLDLQNYIITWLLYFHRQIQSVESEKEFFRISDKQSWKCQAKCAINYKGTSNMRLKCTGSNDFINMKL